MNKRKRYCFICDAKIEKAILNEQHIPKHTVDVCLDCSKITYGYYEEEKTFVKELRDFLSEDNYWMLEHIVIISRKYLKEAK